MLKYATTWNAHAWDAYALKYYQIYVLQIRREINTWILKGRIPFLLSNTWCNLRTLKFGRRKWQDTEEEYVEDNGRTDANNPHNS